MGGLGAAGAGQEAEPQGREERAAHSGGNQERKAGGGGGTRGEMGVLSSALPPPSCVAKRSLSKLVHLVFRWQVTENLL